MRQIEIDLTAEKARPPAQPVGYVGEHNATELLITIPNGMVDASDYQVVVFQSGPLIFRSRRIYPDSDRNGAYREGNCIHCLLGRHLTEEQRLGLQVEAYKIGENGEPVLVGKTAFIPRFTLMASPQGRPGLGFDGDFDDISRTIADTHRHDNAIPISKLTEDAAGNPVYDGKPLGEAGQLIVQTYEDLPVDKPAGTVARTLETSEGLFTGVVTSLQEGDILDAVEISENIAFNGVSSAEEPEGLELYLEDESGDYYRILVYMFNLDGNPILIYEYGFEGESESSYVLYVYTPDSFTAPEDFGFLEFSAGWNLLDFDVPSAAPVAHSELPGIPDNMEVGGVGEEAGLVYPHLRITSYVVNPAGEYVFNGDAWVYQDYAYKAELDSKVDKEEGKGLSANDFDDYHKENCFVISRWGDGYSYLSNNGTYKSITELAAQFEQHGKTFVTDDEKTRLNSIVNTGGGDQYLANDGTYKFIEDIKIIKTEYDWTSDTGKYSDKVYYLPFSQTLNGVIYEKGFYRYQNSETNPLIADFTIPVRRVAVPLASSSWVYDNDTGSYKTEINSDHAALNSLDGSLYNPTYQFTICSFDTSVYVQKYGITFGGIGYSSDAEVYTAIFYSKSQPNAADSVHARLCFLSKGYNITF